MKTKIVSLLLPFFLLCAGCVGGWPKDAYIQGAKSKVNTPWGSSEKSADIMATGSAANNIAKPDQPLILKK